MSDWEVNSEGCENIVQMDDVENRTCHKVQHVENVWETNGQTSIAFNNNRNTERFSYWYRALSVFLCSAWWTCSDTEAEGETKAVSHPQTAASPRTRKDCYKRSQKALGRSLSSQIEPSLPINSAEGISWLLEPIIITKRLQNIS